MKYDADYSTLPELYKGKPESFWHYFDFLPLEDKKNIVSFGEGAIPVEHWDFLDRFAKEKYGELFEANVEQLADSELCPGEEENCLKDGVRCLYHYGNQNFNIETKHNRCPGQQD